LPKAEESSVKRIASDITIRTYDTNLKIRLPQDPEKVDNIDPQFSSSVAAKVEDPSIFRRQGSFLNAKLMPHPLHQNYTESPRGHPMQIQQAPQQINNFAYFPNGTAFTLTRPQPPNSRQASFQNLFASL
jgi:hypothetical protein